MILLTDDWNKRAAADAVPGSYWDSDLDSWVLDEVTPRAAAVALQLFPHLMFDHPELLEIRAELIRDASPIDYATPYWKSLPAAQRRTVGAPRVEAAMAERDWWWKQGVYEKGQPHYQLSDLNHCAAVLERDGGYILGWARGMGKTLGTAAMLDRFDTQAALVVAPNTAKQSTWAAELEWACPWLTVIVLGNLEKDRVASLIRVQELYEAGTPFVLVAHYEGIVTVAGKKTHKTDRRTGREVKLKKPKMREGWSKLGIHWDIKVADEGHRFSNPDTQQSKAWQKIKADQRLLLTGSSFQNKWEELFGQLHAVYPERYKYIARDWTARFLDYVENGYGRICVGILPERIEAMRDELGRFMVLREKVNLAQRTEVKVQLSDGQRQVYDDLAEFCMAELPDGSRLKTETGVSMLGRLRQAASGLNLLSKRVDDSSKLDAAIATIQQRMPEGDDFVCFTWYKESAYALRDRLAELDIRSYVICGDTLQDERALQIKAFQHPDCPVRVMIGTIATMGESINLQRANHVIRIDRSFNPALNQQAVDRVDRQGQTRDVYLTDIVAEDTVDAFVVMPTIINKEAMRAIVFGGAVTA